MSTFTAQQSRVDVLVRLLGFVVMVFGLAFLFYTYANASGAGVAPEIVTINYALGFLLAGVGALAVFAKFK